ncbi:hypothetical protein B7463_g4142, partial [Scytalidium lignicola]
MAFQDNIGSLKEKPVHVEQASHDGYDNEDGAVLAIIDSGVETDLKLASDGHTVLQPQPSDDPNDPLNWSWGKKHSLLAVLVLGSFSCDFSAASQATVVLQGQEWHMNPNDVNRASSLNVLMIGLGGLIWMPVCRFWGRGPVLFWTSLFGFGFVLGATISQNFTTFYAMRGLMSTFQSSFLSVGLFVITDIFYFHEHARKIGFWVVAILSAPWVDPVLSNLILYYTQQWRLVWWMVLAVAALTVVLAFLLRDETYYDRRIPIERQPSRGTRISRVLGIWQLRNRAYFPSVWPSIWRLFEIALKPLVIAAFFYYFLAYIWFIGTGISAPVLLQTPREAGGYGFSNKGVALISIAPFCGVALGETIGHFFNDWLATRYIKQHQGKFVPEARLVTNYVATALMVPGLVVLGQVLQKHLHWIGIVFGWGMYTCGACMVSVALFAYMADSYPNATGEISAILNLSRCIGGFAIAYFELPWGLKSGYDVSFGVESAIVASSVILLLIFQKCGQRLRECGGSVGSL